MRPDVVRLGTALVVASVVVVGGLTALERVFVDERAETRAAVDMEQAGLIEASRVVLARLLAEDARAALAHGRRAAADPTVDAAGVVLAEAGVVVVPLAVPAGASKDAGVRAIVARIRDDAGRVAPVAGFAGPGPLSVAPRAVRGDVDPPPSGARAIDDDRAPASARAHAVDDDRAPAAARTRAVVALGRAARAGDKAAALAAVATLEAHRRAYVLDPPTAIGLDVAAAGFLVDVGLALRGARLVRGDGADAPGEAPGLAAVVLGARDRISDDERAFVVDEAVRVCAAAGVSCAGFARAAALPPSPAPPVPVVGEGPSSPTGAGFAPSQVAPTTPAALVSAGRAVAVVGPGVVVSFPFDAAAAATEIEAALASRMAPGTAPRVELVTGTTPAQPGALHAQPADGAQRPIESVAIVVDAPRFEAARARADARFAVKSGLVGAVGALAAAVVALAVLYQRRRARYVEMKGSLVAAVSHELKTPLASMRLLVESLEKRVVGDARATEYLGRLLKDVDGLTSLVEDLLGVHRLEKGAATLRKELVPLDSLLDDVAAEARERAVREVEIGIDCAPGVHVHADPDLLRMAVKNLVVNALQHNERTPIVIKLRVVDGPVVAIRVKDNGVGVPAGEETRIFEEFHRARREGRASRGSGLGLALVARAAVAHGGRARVVETSPAGTTFELTVPKGRA